MVQKGLVVCSDSRGEQHHFCLLCSAREEFAQCPHLLGGGGLGVFCLFSFVFQVWKGKLTCSKHAFRLSEKVTRAGVEPHSAYRMQNL